MQQDTQITGTEAGLNGDAQIRIALETIISHGGVATIQQIYDAVEKQLGDQNLSKQGKASLRFFVNRIAVKAGYIYPFDKVNPGWKITPEGRDFITLPIEPPEKVVNTENQQQETRQPNTVRGAAFESYVLKLLKSIHPHYTWYYQGRDKKNERGLDFIGERLGDQRGEKKKIGVQVKYHQENDAPTDDEWLKFLSGCFIRQVDGAMFVTSGRLTGEQRRNANEAGITTIVGREEINRIAKLYGIEPFDLFETGD